jgi:Protein of unknown function (DUF3108)
MSESLLVSSRESGAARFVRALVVLVAGAALVSPTRSEAGDAWPSNVQASYDVNFNGINVGTYDFRSTNEGQSYKLSSNAKLSILLGAIHWTGTTHASGKLAGETAKPQAFGFEYQAQSKSGTTQMAFTDDTVTQVLHTPPPKSKDGIVPVQSQHLKGVLDPLSAVLALSRGTTGNPCGRRIPIYDGHQRFDLVLSTKGQIQIADRGGQPGIGYVCRVRYVPIAGHKPDDQTKYMSQNNDIEIILRPMPGANIFIPHQVTIPTMAGSATLVARRVQVTTNAHQQLALIND